MMMMMMMIIFFVALKYTLFIYDYWH